MITDRNKSVLSLTLVPHKYTLLCPGMWETLAGAGKAREVPSVYPYIHLGDLREARRLMLEDILTVQETGIT